MENDLENVSMQASCKTIVLHHIPSSAFSLESFTTETDKADYQTVKLDAATTASFLDNVPVTVHDVASIVADPSRIVCMTAADTVGTSTDTLPDTTVAGCVPNVATSLAVTDSMNSVVTYRIPAQVGDGIGTAATGTVRSVSDTDGVDTVTLVNSISVPGGPDAADLQMQSTAHQLLVNDSGVVGTCSQNPHLFEVQTETVNNHLDATCSASTVPTASTSIDPNVSNATQGNELEPKKRKGGWPKGKKRKKDSKDTGTPKAPTTAYVLYLNEQRSKIKEENPEMAFTDVTKLLGSQWSSMTADEKQKYVEEAENDKKRYIDELKAYQQTEAYQAFLKRQAAKKLSLGDASSIDTEEVASILGALEDDDPNDLYCKTCNQYFSSLHNKKEHLYGRQHLQTLTGKLCEFERETLELENQQQQTTVDDSSTVDSPGDLVTSPNSSVAYSPRSHLTGPVDVEKFKNDFIELNIAREMELRDLRRSYAASSEQNEFLTKQLRELKEKATKYECDIDNFKAYAASLQTQLDGLRMVPTLFGVINF
ncbi:high mobility group protein 20A-like [Ptychodera flava]|uniref:high mobility group protein 20A-like n=1 Tax=Ptychodera flava TaxID=63121 RepID=UPI00396A0F29